MRMAGARPPPHRALDDGRPIDSPEHAGLPVRLEDKVARVQLDGLRHIDLHLGVGIGVG